MTHRRLFRSTLPGGAAPIPRYADVRAIHDSCVACHSTIVTCVERSYAPHSINYDTYAAAIARAENGTEEILEGKMPPEGFDPLIPKEIDEYLRWATCGTPE